MQQQQQSKFQILNKMSSGAFGTVYEANYKHEGKIIKVALKQVFTGTSNIERQITILKNLPNNQHIIKIYDISQENMIINIAMQKGLYDLNQWMRTIQYPIKQIYVLHIAKQILQGLVSLHKEGIIHRDIKPSNILLTNFSTIAICDFGSAVYCQSNNNQYKIQGFTRWYKSPQMLFGYRKYGYQVDIWSLGCVLMELVSGEPFFGGRSELEQLSMIAKILGDPCVKNWPSVNKMPDYQKISFKQIKPLLIKQIAQNRCISQKICTLIMKMVAYQKRLTAQQLLSQNIFQSIKSKSINIVHENPYQYRNKVVGLKNKQE